METRAIVKLVQGSGNPFNTAMASARTCYSRDLVEPHHNPKDVELAQQTYSAGHHTIHQHAHFTFTITGVSRHCVWAFLHAHPFYNSEQQSQRYVQVKQNVFIPALPEWALIHYLSMAEQQHLAYQELTEQIKRQLGCTRNEAMEEARYVLPIATRCNLYHTVSALTLMRYIRSCLLCDTPTEAHHVVSEMVKEVLKHDELYNTILPDPKLKDAFNVGLNNMILAETKQSGILSDKSDAPSTLQPRVKSENFKNDNRSQKSKKFKQSFDAKMGSLSSRLIGHTSSDLIVQAVREVLCDADLTNDECIELALDNKEINSEILNLSTMHNISKAMQHCSFTFMKKLSHTADSQEQRHRMCLTSKPGFYDMYCGQPDYITPRKIMRCDGTTQKKYHEIMKTSWNMVNFLLEKNVPFESVQYLLPQGITIRYTQTSNYNNLHHKCKMRLCYLAQDEIWQSTLQEAQQVSEVEPKLGEHLRPPCTHRYSARTGPFCPEGKRFCGVRVWKLNLNEYKR